MNPQKTGCHAQNGEKPRMGARPRPDPITFDPSITTGETLDEGFQIFTNPNVFSCLPAHRTAQEVTVRDEETIVYTDGSGSNNGDADAKAGSGAWFGRDDPRNSATRTPGPSQSNQAAEVLEIVKAAEATPPLAPLHIIISDS